MPSPEPQRIIELPTIRTLIDAGVIVVCVGGGGIPVRKDEHGALHGVEAVIDKDHSAALLAGELGADALLLLTDVPYVERDHGTPLARPVHEASAEELELEDFAAGSMRPKLEAACRFVARTGKLAAIGALGDAAAILAGKAGTRILAADGSITGTEHTFERLQERGAELGDDVSIASRSAARERAR